MRNDPLLKEYARSLNEDDLGYLISRFKYRLSGDLADVAHALSRDRELDRWLASATSCNGWLEMIDSVEEAVLKEDERRETLFQKEQKEREKKPEEAAA